MDALIAFAQERWLVIVLAIVVILIIVKVVKSMVKWLIILLIAAGLIVYGYQYAGEIREIGGKIAGYTKEEAIRALLDLGTEATYRKEADGTFTVTSGKFTLTGREGAREARLAFGDKSITVEMDSVLAAFVEAAKSAAEQ